MSAAATVRRPRPQLSGFVALSDSQMHAFQTDVTLFPSLPPKLRTRIMVGRCGLQEDARYTEPFDVFRVVPGHRLCVECVHAIEEEVNS